MPITPLAFQAARRLERKAHLRHPSGTGGDGVRDARRAGAVTHEASVT
jgi:hypothetical protein